MTLLLCGLLVIRACKCNLSTIMQRCWISREKLCHCTIPALWLTLCNVSMPGKQLCDRLQLGQEERGQERRDRSKNHGGKWWMEPRHIFHSFFPVMPRPDMRIHTRLQLPSLSFSPTRFFFSPFSANTLLLFPAAICYPSPDFGIKVLPSSSTSNLLSSLFFHYTSLFPL